MNRDVPYIEDEVCDLCGKTGAYDFMGDCICQECINDMQRIIKMRKILCLDFDGVIHSYMSGWKGVDVIPDPPVPGAIEFIKKASKVFDIHIFSSRCSSQSGMVAIYNYMINNGLDHDMFTVSRDKPPAFLTIDDRAITFDGTWPDIDMIQNFEPWYKIIEKKVEFME